MAIAVAVNPQKVVEDPSYAGFVTWVHSVMGVPDEVMRDISILDPYLEMAYDTSINMTYIGLKLVKNRAPYRFLVRQLEPPAPPAVTPPMVEPPDVSNPDPADAADAARSIRRCRSMRLRSTISAGMSYARSRWTIPTCRRRSTPSGPICASGLA